MVMHANEFERNEKRKITEMKNKLQNVLTMCQKGVHLKPFTRF